MNYLQPLSKAFFLPTLNLADSVLEYVRLILVTPRGSFPGDPQFGSSLRTWDPVTGEDLAKELPIQVLQGERRVSDVVVRVERHSDEILKLEIVLRLRSNGKLLGLMAEVILSPLHVRVEAVSP